MRWGGRDLNQAEKGEAFASQSLGQTGGDVHWQGVLHTGRRHGHGREAEAVLGAKRGVWGHRRW